MCEYVYYMSKKHPETDMFHSIKCLLFLGGIKLAIYNSRIVEVYSLCSWFHKQVDLVLTENYKNRNVLLKIFVKSAIFTIWVLNGCYVINVTYCLLHTNDIFLNTMMKWLNDGVVFEDRPISFHIFGAYFWYLLLLVKVDHRKLR